MAGQPTPRKVKPLVPIALIGMMAVLVLATAYGLGQRFKPDAPREANLEADVMPPPGGESDPLAYRVVARWNNWPVSYSFANCPSSLDCATAHDTVRAAFTRWMSIAGVQVQEVESNGQIEISWVSGEHGDSQPFDGRGGVVAHATPPYSSGAHPLDGDIHFDDDEIWVVHMPTAPFPEQVHLPTIALHEIGHALGLGHSDVADSLMWEMYTGVRTITNDDLSAIRSLYGSASTPPLPTVAEDPPEAIPADGEVFATPTTLLRLRSGPSTDYQTLLLVPGGAPYPVIGRVEDQSWVQVSIDGQVGWLAAWLCELEGDPATVPVVTP